MGGKQSRNSIKMTPIPRPQNEDSTSSGRGNSSAQNQKVFEISEVPPKYLNTLGFIDYNHYGQVPWPKGEIILSTKYKSVTPFLAIDCEMVGVGLLQDSALGRVSIVNQYGYCLYDTFVVPSEKVTDYRTKFSGIRSENLINAPKEQAVIRYVKELVRGKTLVGHSIHNDLAVLDLMGHPLIRDTAIYFKQLHALKDTPPLRRLTEDYLKINIQSGEHSSVLDAQATLKLYLMHKEQWEKYLVERLQLANIPATAASNSFVPVSLISDMHVAPREPDLEVDSKEVFLRKNQILGAYSTAEEYLDVQFRLLLEDFLRPLRAGVKTVKIRGPNNTHTFSKVDTLFHNVKIGGAQGGNKIEAKGEGQILVPVERNNLKDVDWEETKMFLNGSLLLLTPDNFKSVKFAVVKYRAKKQQSDSYYISVIVQFSKHGPSWFVDENSRFLMMESRAFYEAYKHTLEYLQVVKFNDFPMKKYIVDVVTQSSPPAYLKAKKNDFLDFSVLMNETESYSNRSHLARPLEMHNWPSAEELNLDPSQYEAFQKALTQELTIIQGPPGTGKTFIGIQIVKLLLSNPFMLSSPILIVSYTNHALDQTLELILKFITEKICKGDEGKAQQLILRIGGGSKSETIQPLTLKDKEEKFTELKKLKAKIKELEEAIEPFSGLNLEQLCFLKGILNFNRLPLIIKTALSTDEESKPIYDKWKKFQMEIYRNPHQWFQLEQKVVPLHGNFNIKEAQLLLIRYASDLNLQPDPFSTSINFVSYLSTRNLETSISATKVTQEQMKTRWHVYIYLVKKIVKILKDKEKEIKAAKQELEQMRNLLNRNNSIKAAKVIGMTTTGAVKYKKMVETLMKPKIMIVEEAAHVLEAHVVASLTEYCEQMIMIGDHKQLRPLTADNNLAVEYNLDVSLMERLVKNGEKQGKKNWIQLKLQHRMRPEIARMVCPVIYQELYNHQDVTKYPDVKGCKKNIFFVDHTNLEAREKGSCSSYNEYEVRYLVGLVQYFVNGGYYRPSQITIIAAYLAQKLLLDNELKNRMLTDSVRVSTVDGFQGEENDIILLSLVRSNAENIVGFLKTDNRVCVALSRARHGLFMIGNMSCLKDCSDTWRKINKILTEMGCISDKLPLTGSGFRIPSSIELSILQVPAVNLGKERERPKLNARRRKEDKTVEPFKSEAKAPSHPFTTKAKIATEMQTLERTILKAQRFSDLLKAESKPALPLPASSTVDRPVLTTANAVNTKIEPMFSVYRSNPRDFWPGSSAVDKKSSDLVKEESKAALPASSTLDRPILTARRHNTTTADAVNVVNKNSEVDEAALYLQQMSLESSSSTAKSKLVKLPCRHMQNLTKRQMQNISEVKCITPVNKKLPCGHYTRLHCHINVENARCNREISLEFPCGHIRSAYCHQKDSLTCSEWTKKDLPCGHRTTTKVICSVDVSTFYCQKKVTKILRCGHEHEEKIACSRDISTVKCIVPVMKKLPCGHEQKIHCHLDARNFKCCRRVEVELDCGHETSVSCYQYENDDLPDCQEEVVKTLPCDHEHNLICSKDISTVKCIVHVVKKLPCGHEKKIHCHMDVWSITCNQNVTVKLPCGHEHNSICSKDVSNVKCITPVLKELPCGHEQKIHCHMNAWSITCTRNVTVDLDCGHETHTLKCYQYENGEIPECLTEVTKILPCGHELNAICSRDVSYVKCINPVLKKLPCGHEQRSHCHMDASNIKCHKSVEVDLDCGHETHTLKCYQYENGEIPDCQTKVLKKLSCGHTVETTCGLDEDEIECDAQVGFYFTSCKEHRQSTLCYLYHRGNGKNGKCGFNVLKRLSCGHENRMACHVDPNTVECKETFVSSCIHKTFLKCGRSCRACEASLAKAMRNLSMGSSSSGFNGAGSSSASRSTTPGSTTSGTCRKVFSCGHYCALPYCTKNEMQPHYQYKCKEACERKCTRGHKCPGDHDCYFRCDVRAGKSCKFFVRVNGGGFKECCTVSG